MSDHKTRWRQLVYLATLFLTAHYALAIYVNSSFLRQFVSERALGMVYAAASLLSIWLLFQLPRLDAKFGLIRATVLLGVIKLVTTILLPLNFGPAFVVFDFIIYSALAITLIFNLDRYLEHWSDNPHTGAIRGVYLTVTNATFVAMPAITGLLLGQNDYWKVYAASAIALLAFVLVIWRLPEFKPKTARALPTLSETKKFWRIFSLDFLLNFFYAIMVIYVPLYLHGQIGLTWPELGLIFTIMLVPFPLLDLPLGLAADKWWGEKEVLIGGILIMGVSTILVARLHTASWQWWAALLFLTRVGAASVEMMKETYLFKKISAADSGILTASRNLYPLAYLIAPLAASAVLSFTTLPLLFTLTGLAILAGLYPALTLRDTR